MSIQITSVTIFFAMLHGFFSKSGWRHETPAPVRAAKVSLGDLPKRVRYATEKRPRWVKPLRKAMSESCSPER